VGVKTALVSPLASHARKPPRTTVGVSLGSFACPVLRLISSHCSQHTPLRVTNITLLLFLLHVQFLRGSSLPPGFIINSAASPRPSFLPRRDTWVFARLVTYVLSHISRFSQTWFRSRRSIFPGHRPSSFSSHLFLFISSYRSHPSSGLHFFAPRLSFSESFLEISFV